MLLLTLLIILTSSDDTGRLFYIAEELLLILYIGDTNNRLYDQQQFFRFLQSPCIPEDFSTSSNASNSIELLIHGRSLIIRDRPTLNSQTSYIQLTLF